MHFVNKLYLCVLYDFYNKDTLSAYTTFIDRSFSNGKHCVLCDIDLFQPSKG